MALFVGVPGMAQYARYRPETSAHAAAGPLNITVLADLTMFYDRIWQVYEDLVTSSGASGNQRLKP